MVQWAPTCPGSRLHFGFSSSSSAVPVPSANRIRASFPLPASACVASIDRMAGSTCWSSRQHVNIMTLRAMTSVMRLWRSATERRCQPIRRSVTDARVTLLLNLLIFLGGGIYAWFLANFIVKAAQAREGALHKYGAGNIWIFQNIIFILCKTTRFYLQPHHLDTAVMFCLLPNKKHLWNLPDTRVDKNHDLKKIMI